MTSRLARRVALLCATAAGLCALPAAAAPPLPDTPIAFVANNYPAEGSWLVGVRPDGSDLTNLSMPFAGLRFASPNVSPDGSHFLSLSLVERTSIEQPQWRIDLRSSRLDGTDDRSIFFNEQGNVNQGRWSPTGAQIAFIAEVRPGAFGTNGTGLFVANADGTDLRRVDDTESGGGLAFTPDGGSIVYRTIITDPDLIPSGCLVSVPAATFVREELASGALTVLDPCDAERRGGDAGGIDIAPDGRLSYLTTGSIFAIDGEGVERRYSTRRLWVSEPDGTNARLVSETAENLDPWWVAREPQAPAAFSPDGNWLLVTRVFRSGQPRDLALIAIADGTVVPVPGTARSTGEGTWNVNLPLVDAPPPPPDTDGDGVADSSDNCPMSANPGQEDTDGDGLGDACDVVVDGDGDGIADTADNCPMTANPGQEDTDGDGAGDLCDTDLDNDGIDNAIDTGLGTFADDNAPVITEGTIVDRAGLDVTVSDVAAPEGVRIVVGSGTGKARLQVCQGFTIRVAAGSEVVVTCGSVKLGVVDGEAEIVLGDASTIVTVPEGGTAKVDTTGTDTYTLQNTGTVPVSVTVDGATASVPAGSTAPVATWNFTGFNAPVDNPPVVNLVKAGRAIPLKWRVTRSDGAPVTNLTTATITTVRISCSTGATTDEVEETTAGGSGLLNQGNGNYQLNWKSQTTHAGTCRELRLDIGDGVRHTALFRFN